MSGLQTGQVSASTSAILVCTVGSTYPDNDSVIVSASAACFIGGTSSVTTTTGFPLAANTPVLVPTTGAEPISIYAITSSGTATVSYAFPG
jgi:hypothetical protein